MTLRTITVTTSVTTSGPSVSDAAVSAAVAAGTLRLEYVRAGMSDGAAAAVLMGALMSLELASTMAYAAARQLGLDGAAWKGYVDGFRTGADGALVR